MPLGMGFMHYTPGPLSREDAERIWAEDVYPLGRKYFDYVNGRVMKVDLCGDELRVGLFDRDNGEGAARMALVKAGLIKGAAA